MDTNGIGARRLSMMYDDLLLNTLKRYGYDLKTTLYLLSIGEMRIEKDEIGHVTTFYGPGEPWRKQFYTHRMIPLFSITEETINQYAPDDKIGISCKTMNRLRVKDLTNNREILGANVVF